MNIEHISVSRAKTYKECPQHYKYHYHLKLPSPIEEPFYFIYGKIVHKIAEEYVRNKAEVSLGSLWQEIKCGNMEIEPNVKAPPLPKEYEQRLPIHLKAIQNLTRKIGTDGLLEHKFYYDLDPPNGKFAKGFIDRLIIRDNKAFIIDYKTTKKGKWRVNKETVKFDPQLRMYAKVVQNEFGIAAENISCALFYLEDEEIVNYRYNEASLGLIEQEMLEAYNKINEHNPDHVVGYTGFHCDRCPFRTICPFKRSNSTMASWDGNMDHIIKG
jgi:CRISPR/Cas system-associated exonuclease Cas4 (RecB family)